MEFRILGPLEVRDGEGVPCRSRAPSSGRCSRCLLLHANQVVSRDRLIDELWGGEPPETAVQSAAGQRLPAAQGTRPRRLADARARLRARARAGRARPAPLRAVLAEDALRAGPTRGGRGAARRRSRSGAAGACGSRLRAVRAGRDRPARGAAPGRGRGADRGRPRARPPCRARRELEALVAEQPAARAPPRPAHARALPRGPTGRGASALPGRTRERSSTSSGSSRARPGAPRESILAQDTISTLRGNGGSSERCRDRGEENG